MSATATGPIAGRTRIDPAPRRCPVGLAVTLLLTAVTALVVTALALTLCGPLLPATPAAAVPQNDVVHHFYGAVNAVLAGADTSAVVDLLAPGFSAHDPDGRAFDPADFAAHLAAIARAVPGMQLAIGPIVGDGAWLAVQALPEGGGRLTAAAGIVGDSAPTMTMDRLQLADDRIVGYWPSAALTVLPQTLPPLALGVWPAPTPVTLARFVYAPGANLDDLVAPGPQLVLLETGRLTVRLAGAASWFVAAHPALGWQTTNPSGQALTLEAGDALFVPANVDQTQRNLGADPATALGLAMFPPTVLPVADAPQAVAMYNPDRHGLVSAWPTAVWVDVLATGFGGTATGPCLAAPLALTMTRFALAPGATWTTPSVASVALLTRDDAWLVDAFPIGSIEPSAPQPGALAMAERGLASADGRLPGVRNLSAQPLPLVLFAATPLTTPACRPAGSTPVSRGDAGYQRKEA